MLDRSKNAFLGNGSPAANMLDRREDVFLGNGSPPRKILTIATARVSSVVSLLLFVVFLPLSVVVRRSLFSLLSSLFCLLSSFFTIRLYFLLLPCFSVPSSSLTSVVLLLSPLSLGHKMICKRLHARLRRRRRSPLQSETRVPLEHGANILKIRFFSHKRLKLLCPSQTSNIYVSCPLLSKSLPLGCRAGPSLWPFPSEIVI